MSRQTKRRRLLRGFVLLALSLGFFSGGMALLVVSTWKVPDLASLGARKVRESTKLYDRTGEVLLYDFHRGEQRRVIPVAEISRHLKNATVAIEDDTFWEHRGVRPKAILRAMLVNLVSGGFSQGGSTITQQVVKNSLLTSEKKVSRKLKEWVLAWKLEETLAKEEILGLYLNEAPYGGEVYGAEEAAQVFFDKSARDLTVAESAYLAALPNAPTFFSPYGNNRDKLEERKDLVLERMRESGFVTSEEFQAAKRERVSFQPYAGTGILAPHFVFFIRQYLEEKYGRDRLEEGGLTVTTTLHYPLQQKAEETVKQYALENKKTFDAENAALVALDPQSGEILAMVGSRDYFDKEIDGNFNAALASRQPGSAFKPFVYAAAFRKGLTPETVLFDLQTEFSTECNPDGTPILPEKADKCYRPGNYDEKYRGPVSLRDALAQSINVPSVKTLYLAGLKESLRLAKDMGLTTLTEPDRYGLTLVLGGGEVKLLELTSAYGVFAADGVRHAPTGILRVAGRGGETLEELVPRGEPVLSEEAAETINDILSDNRARAPAFSLVSPLHFPGREVAAKTGTTNDFRDAWIVGYTPSLAVGAWAGNNDNRPMQKKVAAFIVAPLWHAFMKEALKETEPERFRKPPERERDALPPALRGIWQGQKTYVVDRLSGKRATAFTPLTLREERAVRSLHSILYSIDRDAPTLPRSAPPESDPQFPRWEYVVRKWAEENRLTDEPETIIPSEEDDLHRPEFAPKVEVLAPKEGATVPRASALLVRASATGRFAAAKINFFLDNIFLGSATKPPWEFRFSPEEAGADAGVHELKAVAYDTVENSGEARITVTVTE